MNRQLYLDLRLQVQTVQSVREREAVERAIERASSGPKDLHRTALLEQLRLVARARAVA